MGSSMLYSVERMNDPTLVSADMNKRETVLTRLKILFDVSIINSSLMCVVFILWILFCMGTPVTSVFLPLVTSNYGMSKDTVSFMLSVFGFSDFFGRILFGITANFTKIPPVYLWCFASVVAGIAQLCLTWAKTIPTIYILVLTIGVNGGEFHNDDDDDDNNDDDDSDFFKTFCLGGWLVCSSVALVDLFGIDKVAKCYGIMMIAHATAFFTSSTLHGQYQIFVCMNNHGLSNCNIGAYSYFREGILL